LAIGKPGSSLLRASRLVAECRAIHPNGDYPHVGDVQWWFRDPRLEKPESWRFWDDKRGDDTAFCLAFAGSITLVVHPRARCAGLYREMLDWAEANIAADTRASGQERADPSCCKATVTAADDDGPLTALLIDSGYAKAGWHYLRHQGLLNGSAPCTALPAGYRLRSARPADRDAQYDLHLRAFSPYTGSSRRAELQSMGRHQRTPGYDRAMDLVVESPSGQLVAECIAWADDVSQVGLVQPLGVDPDHRRMGLATSLVNEARARLAERHMRSIAATSIHPGDGYDLPLAFTSSRHVFAGCDMPAIRSVSRFQKRFDGPVGSA